MIEIEGVTKGFPPDVVAVKDVDLRVEDGEFVVLVGPSGCGKSTLLNLVAGLDVPTDGTIRIDGADVTGAAPQDRDVAMIFQNYALYPHMTARENIGFPLRMRNMSRQAIRQKVVEVARTLELEALLDRHPAELSGGQRQRVAMGRAMVREPRAFLMDEPLSNLDAALRVQMREQLARLRGDLDTTTVYVTHDQVEAMTLGDRVAVMDRGVLQQYASPTTLYDHPANLFVGRFLGSPAMNVVPARLERGVVRVAGTELPGPQPDGAGGRDVIVGIRPPSFEASEFCGEEGWPRLDVRVDMVEALGSETLVYCTLAQASLVARVDRRTDARPRTSLRLAVDPHGLYYFDSRTHESL